MYNVCVLVRLTVEQLISKDEDLVHHCPSTRIVNHVTLDMCVLYHLSNPLLGHILNQVQ